MHTDFRSDAQTQSAVHELTTLQLRNDNRYIKEWKKAGGKVVGFTCNYVPEELLCSIIGSNSILPIRMGAQGCTSAKDADIYLHLPIVVKRSNSLESPGY